jgi:hypothetical protein
MTPEQCDSVLALIKDAILEERRACAKLAFNWEPEVWVPDVDIARGIRDAILARSSVSSAGSLPSAAEIDPSASHCPTPIRPGLAPE